MKFRFDDPRYVMGIGMVTVLALTIAIFARYYSLPTVPRPKHFTYNRNISHKQDTKTPTPITPMVKNISPTPAPSFVPLPTSVETFVNHIALNTEQVNQIIDFVPDDDLNIKDLKITLGSKVIDINFQLTSPIKADVNAKVEVSVIDSEIKVKLLEAKVGKLPLPGFAKSAAEKEINMVFSESLMQIPNLIVEDIYVEAGKLNIVGLIPRDLLYSL